MLPSTMGVVGGAGLRTINMQKLKTQKVIGIFLTATYGIGSKADKFTSRPDGDAAAVGDDGGGDGGVKADDWRKGWPLPPLSMATLRQRRPPLTWSC